MFLAKIVNIAINFDWLVGKCRKVRGILTRTSVAPGNEKFSHANTRAQKHTHKHSRAHARPVSAHAPNEVSICGGSRAMRAEIARLS